MNTINSSSPDALAGQARAEFFSSYQGSTRYGNVIKDAEKTAEHYHDAVNNAFYQSIKAAFQHGYINGYNAAENERDTWERREASVQELSNETTTPEPLHTYSCNRCGLEHTRGDYMIGPKLMWCSRCYTATKHVLMSPDRFTNWNLNCLVENHVEEEKYVEEEKEDGEELESTDLFRVYMHSLAVESAAGVAREEAFKEWVKQSEIEHKPTLPKFMPLKAYMCLQCNQEVLLACKEMFTNSWCGTCEYVTKWILKPQLDLVAHE